VSVRRLVMAHAIAALSLAWAGPSLAQAASTSVTPTGEKNSLGGPSSVSSQLGTDEKARQAAGAIPTAAPLQPLEQLREAWQRDYGLQLGVDYNALYQHATESLGKNDAAGNVFRLYGRWTPFNRGAPDAGSLVFKAEYRDKLGTSISPQVLGPMAGYAGLTAPTFSDAGGVLTNLFWAQAFAGNRFAFNAGVVDVTDYLDVFGLVNVWTDFNNLSFSTNPTIPAPSQGLGAVARWMFTPNYYVVAGLADANGDPHHPGDFFSSFFSDREFFYHAEFGWIESWDKRYSDNVHVSLWGQDPREAAGVGRGKGITFSASRTVNDRWLPFFRAGYSDGGGAFVDRSVGAGVGYRINERNDYVGVGAAWARAPGSDENQYTYEAYYRLQLLRQVQLVPDVQFIVNPANDPSTNSLWVIGLRLRVAL
jgi:porin